MGILIKSARLTTGYCGFELGCDGLKQMLWCLYLLECKGGSFYAGITNDLEARFQAHLEGRGAKYTRANPPIKILAQKSYANRSEASVAEAKLKKMPKSQKLAFFDEFESDV